MWGEIHVSDLDQYADAYLYEGQQKTLTSSCYLIQNGDRYFLWETGLSAELAGTSQLQGGDRMSLSRTIPDQLAEIGVSREQVTLMGVSHYHFDHTGQAASFPSATLIVGKLDWEAIQARPDRADRFRPWIDNASGLQLVTGDHDVFGDGRVVMLSTPGHTPGHHALLVRLPQTGPVLLTGDVYHFAENLANDGVPRFNTNRADSLASMSRLQRIARTLGATMVIQHEPADVAKLPAFPDAAR